MHLTRCRSASFSGAMAFTNDGCPIRLDSNPDSGDVDRQEAPAVLAGKDATGLNRLPVPTVKSENPVGL